MCGCYHGRRKRGMSETHVPSADFNKWRTLILPRGLALLGPSKPPVLLRSKLTALNLGASEIIESKRCRCIVAELFKTHYTSHKGETETKSDSFACCEPIRKTGGFFVCLTSAFPCRPRVPLSCPVEKPLLHFLTFDGLGGTASPRSSPVVLIIFMKLKPLGS